VTAPTTSGVEPTELRPEVSLIADAPWRLTLWRRLSNRLTLTDGPLLSNPCLVWTGAHNDRGYGQVRIPWAHPTRALTAQWRTVYVHRLVWGLFWGPLYAGFEIDHTCRIRLCVVHLVQVEARENKRRIAPTYRRQHNI
jgi:HNH endonuclease